MAVIFSAPVYSFLQFTEPTQYCAWVDRPCLPVATLEDLQFQVIAFVDGADKATFAGNQWNAGTTVNCDTPGVLGASFIGSWHKYETGSGGDPDKWVGYMAFDTEGYFTTYGVGQCFNVIMFSATDASQHPCFETCFVKILDTCFTSILAYRGSSNIFGFNYTSFTYNRVRLPLYCHSPLFAEEKTEYAKSDGSTVLLSYRLWEDFKIKTDYLTKEIHSKIGVALSHSDIRITDTYSGLNQVSIVRTEKIELNWIEQDTPQFVLAQGATTIRIAADSPNVNSNCE